jgi:hypothetical protein
VVKGVNLSVAASYLNAAQPHPPLSANRLLSFTMKSTSCRLAGTAVVVKVACIFGFQWILAILTPSGNGWPLSGMPAWKALIISGLARVTASSLSLWLMETVGQLSYPLNSENASPPGTCTVYLAGPASCAMTARPPRTPSPTSETVMITIAASPLRVISTLPVGAGARLADSRAIRRTGVLRS